MSGRLFFLGAANPNIHVSHKVLLGALGLAGWFPYGTSPPFAVSIGNLSVFTHFHAGANVADAELAWVWCEI